jgi:uncharacterized protein
VSLDLEDLMKIVQIGLIAAALTAAVAYAGVGRPEPAHGSSPSTRSVTVSGSGSVEAVPNRAGFSFGVSSTAATAQAAVAANAARAQRVIAALREAGVAKQDLRTEDVSVSRHWDQNGREDGFTAHNSVRVEVRAVASAGAIVDAAVAAGATETSGPSFDRGDRDALYRGALKAAFAEARAKAETLAGEANASLGAVLRIEETSQQVVPVPMYDRMAMSAEKTPVEPGTQEVQATVTVTFSLA